MCLVGVVVRRYIDFLITYPTPLVSTLFCSSSPHVFRSLYIYIFFLDSSIFFLRSTVEPLYFGHPRDRKMCP